MELSKEGSLYRKMKLEKKMTETKTGRLMWNVLTALNHLHNQDPPVLHRDLKPENLLMFPNDQVKITDFGWSAEYNDVRNTFCGTQEYLAPEMIKGTGHDEKLDVWTLGILIFELIHGKTPFYIGGKGVNIRSQRKIIEKNILEGIFTMDESINPSTKEAIMAMLQPDKEKRPTTKELMQISFFSRAINPMKKSKSMKILENQENINMKEVSSLRLKTAQLKKTNEYLLKENKELLIQVQKANSTDLVNQLKKFKEEMSKLNKSNQELKSDNKRMEEDIGFSQKELRTLTSKLNKKNLNLVKAETTLQKIKEINKYIFKKSKVNI